MTHLWSIASVVKRSRSSFFCALTIRTFCIPSYLSKRDPVFAMSCSHSQRDHHNLAKLPSISLLRDLAQPAGDLAAGLTRKSRFPDRRGHPTIRLS